MVIDMSHTDSQQHNPARRRFATRAAYLAPALLTLPAAPAYAKNGSIKPGKPAHADTSGPPPHAGVPGKPPHAGKP